MKRYFSILFSLLLLVSFAVVPVMAETPKTERKVHHKKGSKDKGKGHHKAKSKKTKPKKETTEAPAPAAQPQAETAPPVAK